jgi:hypothetical protein
MNKRGRRFNREKWGWKNESEIKHYCKYYTDERRWKDALLINTIGWVGVGACIAWIGIGEILKMLA